MLLATATIYVPSPDQEIALHILPSPLPSLWDPPGYRVQQPIWVGPPGSPFIVAPPISGCSGQPVCVVNDDGEGPPLFLSATGNTDFGAVPIGQRPHAHDHRDQSLSGDHVWHADPQRRRIRLPARHGGLDHAAHVVPHRIRGQPRRAGALLAVRGRAALRRPHRGELRAAAGAAVDGRRRRRAAGEPGAAVARVRLDGAERPARPDLHRPQRRRRASELLAASRGERGFRADRRRHGLHAGPRRQPARRRPLLADAHGRPDGARRLRPAGRAGPAPARHGVAGLGRLSGGPGRRRHRRLRRVRRGADGGRAR